MYVCVCVYVCMYLRILCMYACMYVCIISVYAYVDIPHLQGKLMTIIPMHTI